MNKTINKLGHEPTKLPKPAIKVQTYITEAEYEAFREALKRSGRYHSMSDALRDFIRDFVDAQGVTPRSVVGVSSSKKKEAEADSDA